ncbi:hypothetical protein KBC75_02985 [Candidatus Shapirobacteria bacterium]|nr:hypothetical protein [Candidatus Shapirobacteria bacterium]
MPDTPETKVEPTNPQTTYFHLKSFLRVIHDCNITTDQLPACIHHMNGRCDLIFNAVCRGDRTGEEVIAENQTMRVISGPENVT